MNLPPPTLKGRHTASAIIWLTGLSGAGKSTVAEQTSNALAALPVDCLIIDGDILRHTLCRDLGYSVADRKENARRATGHALACAIGRAVLVAMITPFQDAREETRQRCRAAGIPYGLVYLDAPLACCESRDPKGLYARARQGQIKESTGISSPYQTPDDADLVLHTAEESTATSVQRLTQFSFRTAGINFPAAAVHHGPPLKFPDLLPHV